MKAIAMMVTAALVALCLAPVAGEPMYKQQDPPPKNPSAILEEDIVQRTCMTIGNCNYSVVCEDAQLDIIVTSVSSLGVILTDVTIQDYADGYAYSDAKMSGHLGSYWPIGHVEKLRSSLSIKPEDMAMLQSKFELDLLAADQCVLDARRQERINQMIKNSI